LGLRQIDSSNERPGFLAGHLRIWLHKRPKATRGPLPEWGAILLPTPGGIEPRIRELAERGVSFSASLIETPQGRMAQFHDPDGHPLGVWETPAEPAAPAEAQPAQPAMLVSPEEARRLREIDELLTKAEEAKSSGNYLDAVRLYRIVVEARPG